jgi:glucose-1-phosphate adenylyltransferase
MDAFPLLRALKTPLTNGEQAGCDERRRHMFNVLTIILAGGVGERMSPLTRDQAKPMIPFGGIYHLIDITLSNCLNSGLNKIYVLTQYKALSLYRHLRGTWNILSPELNQFIEAIPPMRRLRDTWYLGTADAVYQNIQSIEDEDVDMVLILSADHIYKMNYGSMIRWHCDKKADVTLSTTHILPFEAPRFGIVQLDDDFRICEFEEKPKHDHPWRSVFNSETCSASMGIYLFSTEVLLKALHDDAADAASSHDFGIDILPRLVRRGSAFAYDFVDENRKELRYWRDVGTLDTYYEANMDLTAVTPVFNLYDRDWPLRSALAQYPPAKFVFADEGQRMGVALDSLISQGCVISGGKVIRSVLSPGVRINSFCTVEDSILFPDVQIGRYSHIRHAIIDQHLRLPENSSIGLDPVADRNAGHFVTRKGVVVIHSQSPGVTLLAPHRRPDRPGETL